MERLGARRVCGTRTLVIVDVAGPRRTVVPEVHAAHRAGPTGRSVTPVLGVHAKVEAALVGVPTTAREAGGATEEAVAVPTPKASAGRLAATATATADGVGVLAATVP